jgi:ABC-type Na+ transport system ATPase subunit NatA
LQSAERASREAEEPQLQLGKVSRGLKGSPRVRVTHQVLHDPARPALSQSVTTHCCIDCRVPAVIDPEIHACSTVGLVTLFSTHLVEAENKNL